MLAVPADVTGLDVAFGDIKHLPRFTDLPEEFRRERSPYCDVAQALFFRGGKLADYGLKFKEGIDAAQASGAIRACLASFEPPHEHKIAGVGYMLSQWCDGTPNDVRR